MDVWRTCRFPKSHPTIKYEFISSFNAFSYRNTIKRVISIWCDRTRRKDSSSSSSLPTSLDEIKPYCCCSKYMLPLFLLPTHQFTAHFQGQISKTLLPYNTNHRFGNGIVFLCCFLRWQPIIRDRNCQHWASAHGSDKSNLLLDLCLVFFRVGLLGARLSSIERRDFVVDTWMHWLISWLLTRHFNLQVQIWQFD